MSSAKALPQFHPELRGAPGSSEGERIMLRPFPPPEEGEGGLAIPSVAQERPFAGIIIDVGIDAADKMYQRDGRIGDEVWWGKYSGVIEEWHRIVKDGTDAACKHAGQWDFMKSEGDRMQRRRCGTCGAEKLSEPIIVANVADILVNVSRRLRLERGEVRRIRGTTADGKPTYYYERVKDDGRDSLEIKE